MSEKQDSSPEGAPADAPLSATTGEHSFWERHGGKVAIAVGILLALTNPNEAQFKRWIASQPKQGGIVGDMLATAVCSDVQTADYMLFSRYERQCLGIVERCVGALNTFYCEKATEAATKQR